MEESKKNKKIILIVLLKILQYIPVALLLAFFLFMTFRIISSGDTELSKKYLWTEKSKIIYENSPEELSFYKVEVPQNFTNDGQFFITNILYTESEDEKISDFQFTVRYNDSTLKTLTEFYKLAENPGIGHFVYTLGDNKGNIYSDYEIIHDERLNYNYERMIFTDIDMTGIEKIYLNIYYDNEYKSETALSVDTGYDESAYGTMTVYTSSIDANLYKLKKADLPS